VLAEINRALIAGQRETFTGARKISDVAEQAVVFEETDEDARENPRDCRLSELGFAPRFVGFGSAFGRASRIVLDTQRRFDFGTFGAARAEVVLEFNEEFLEVGKECEAVDHLVGP
jgi:hypothetical protein